MNVNQEIADKIVEICRKKSLSGNYIIDSDETYQSLGYKDKIDSDIITDLIAQHEAVAEVEFNEDGEFDIMLFTNYVYGYVSDDEEDEEELEQLKDDISIWLYKQGVDVVFVASEGGFDYYIDNPRRTQLLEAIEMNYDDVDYDKWQALEDRMTEENHGINTEISFKEAMIMIRGLELYGINVLA